MRFVSGCLRNLLLNGKPVECCPVANCEDIMDWTSNRNSGLVVEIVQIVAKDYGFPYEKLLVGSPGKDTFTEAHQVAYYFVMTQLSGVAGIRMLLGTLNLKSDKPLHDAVSVIRGLLSRESRDKSRLTDQEVILCDRLSRIKALLA